MPRLNIDFDDVPNEILPVKPEAYDFEVTESPEIKPTNDGLGTKMVVTLRIATEGEFKGRILTDHVSTRNQTRCKRVFLAAGIEPNQDTETEELAGKSLRALVQTRKYQDPSTGEDKEGSGIKDYILP